MSSNRRVRTGALILVTLCSVLALAAVGICPVSADPQREGVWGDLTGGSGGGGGGPTGIGDPDVPTGNGSRSLKQRVRGGSGAGSLQAVGDGVRGNSRVELWITWLRTFRGTFFTF
jgi:hypothetical protein